MPSNKLSGNVIGLEIDGKFISCETSCEIRYKSEMIPASAVDDGGWKSFIPGAKDWSVSLNAFMLINSAASDHATILNAFMFGKRVGLRFASKYTSISSFELTGYAYVEDGGINGTVNTTTSYNTTLRGDGPLNPSEGEQVIARYGFRLEDPFGDEGSLVPQFSKTIDPEALSVSLDYTKPSADNYLYAIFPHGTTLFNKWENNEINFGDIPDFVWRAPYTIGAFDYYVTNAPIYFTSAVPIVTFKLKSTTPNPFTFEDIISALRSTEYISNEITVTGITEPVPISIAGGIGYSINGAAYTNTPGLIGNGDKVRVKLLTSAAYNTAVSAVLTIGSVSDSYDVTTQLDAALFYAYNTDIFYKEGCVLPNVGSAVPFSKTYSGASQPAADAAAAADLSNFNILGQANANSIGYCAVPAAQLWGKITEEDVEEVGYSGYSTVWLRIYKGTSDTVPPAAISGNLYPLPAASILMQYRQEGDSPGAPFTWSPNTYMLSEIKLITPNPPFDPAYNPLYPKQLIYIHGGTTYMYFAPPGKARDEMFYIGAY